MTNVVMHTVDPTLVVVLMGLVYYLPTIIAGASDLPVFISFFHYQYATNMPIGSFFFDNVFVHVWKHHQYLHDPSYFADRYCPTDARVCLIEPMLKMIGEDLAWADYLQHWWNSIVIRTSHLTTFTATWTSIEKGRLTFESLFQLTLLMLAAWTITTYLGTVRQNRDSQNFQSQQLTTVISIQSDLVATVTNISNMVRSISERAAEQTGVKTQHIVNVATQSIMAKIEAIGQPEQLTSLKDAYSSIVTTVNNILDVALAVSKRSLAIQDVVQAIQAQLEEVELYGAPPLRVPPPPPPMFPGSGDADKKDDDDDTAGGAGSSGARGSMSDAGTQTDKQESSDRASVVQPADDSKDSTPNDGSAAPTTDPVTTPAPMPEPAPEAEPAPESVPEPVPAAEPVRKPEPAVEPEPEPVLGPEPVTEPEQTAPASAPQDPSSPSWFPPDFPEDMKRYVLHVHDKNDQCTNCSKGSHCADCCTSCGGCGKPWGKVCMTTCTRQTYPHHGRKIPIPGVETRKGGASPAMIEQITARELEKGRKLAAVKAEKARRKGL